MDRTIRFTLDTKSVGNKMVIDGLVRGDTRSVTLRAMISDGNRILDLDGCKATIVAIKPDSKKLNDDCMIEGNEIVYTLPTQITTTAGDVECEFVITDNSDLDLVAQTQKFTLLVNDNVYVPMYSKIDEQPTDWQDNFSTYYEYDEEYGYTHISGDSAPEFISGKYYYLLNPITDSDDSFNAFFNALSRAESLIGKASDIDAELSNKADLVYINGNFYTIDRINDILKTYLLNNKDSISELNIKPNAVTNAKIKNGEIDESKLDPALLKKIEEGYDDTEIRQELGKKCGKDYVDEAIDEIVSKHNQENYWTEGTNLEGGTGFIDGKYFSKDAENYLKENADCATSPFIRISAGDTGIIYLEGIMPINDVTVIHSQCRIAFFSDNGFEGQYQLKESNHAIYDENKLLIGYDLSKLTAYKDSNKFCVSLNYSQLMGENFIGIFKERYYQSTELNPKVTVNSDNIVGGAVSEDKLSPEVQEKLNSGGGEIVVKDNNDYCLDNDTLHSYWQNVIYDKDYSYSRIDDFLTEYRTDKPVPVKFVTKESTTEVQIADNPEMNDCRSIDVNSTEGCCLIDNLIPNRMYFIDETDSFWNIVNSTTIETTGCRRMCDVGGVINVRDFGGLKTSDGRTIKYGRLYRGGELNGITADGRTTMLDVLGINAELDYRSDSEGTTSVLGLTDYLNVQIKPFSTIYKSTQGFDQLYGTAFKQILNWLKAGKSIYTHCVSGADRTGAMAAIIEGVLGVSENDINKDYEITSFVDTARYRSRAIEETKKYYFADAMNKVRNLNGATYKDKWRIFLMSCGVTSDEISEFEEIMLGDASAEVDVPAYINSIKSTEITADSTDQQLASAKAVYDLSAEKIDKPTEQGTAGQVLGLDENGLPKWVDTQGSGSTKDYELLIDWTAEEEVAQVHFYQGDNGQNLSDYNELYVMAMNKKMATPTTTSLNIKILFGKTKNIANDACADLISSLISSGYQCYSISKYEKTNFGIHQIMRLASNNTSSMLQILKTGTNSFVENAFTTEGLLATPNTDTNDLGAIKICKNNDWNEIHIGSYTTCFGIGAQIKIYGRK